MDPEPLIPRFAVVTVNIIMLVNVTAQVLENLYASRYQSLRRQLKLIGRNGWNFKEQVHTLNIPTIKTSVRIPLT
jgi:hypothetical protein